MKVSWKIRRLITVWINNRFFSVRRCIDRLLRCCPRLSCLPIRCMAIRSPNRPIRLGPSYPCCPSLMGPPCLSRPPSRLRSPSCLCLSRSLRSPSCCPSRQGRCHLHRRHPWSRPHRPIGRPCCLKNQRQLGSSPRNLVNSQKILPPIPINQKTNKWKCFKIVKLKNNCVSFSYHFSHSKHLWNVSVATNSVHGQHHSIIRSLKQKFIGVVWNCLVQLKKEENRSKWHKTKRLFAVYERGEFVKDVNDI
jgi:hypothetical protein